MEAGRAFDERAAIRTMDGSRDNNLTAATGLRR